MEHSSDKAMWEYCRAIDCESDEAERFLDLAGFVDARLDSDERERVAALLVADPAAASDIAAAPVVVAAAAAEVSERLIARAVALVGEPARGQVIRFAPRVRPRPTFTLFAQWGSVAAAIVVASWLGFALGTDTSIAYNQTVQQPSEDGFLGDLIDPSGGILHTITDGLES
ncbi:MAG: hypothetical protein ACREFB_20230 [Stellaceae bacterium]